MISKRIVLKEQDWILWLYVAVTRYDSNAILSKVKSIGAGGKLLERMKSSLMRGRMNSGFTYSNRMMRESVMVIGLTTKASQEMNSAVHELRHLVDDIATTDGMQMCGEAVAYLSGDIAAEIFGVISPLLCDRCRH